MTRRTCGRGTDKPGSRDDTLYDSAVADNLIAGNGADIIRATRGGDERNEHNASNDELYWRAA